ncbi:hypothetical protein V9K67_05240 [Paraflavisolibacter sp. H34]|uniref:hypothetical protein n=1 Tax=Huijunlia imazamoxiresistens TaxID=3127457 RepID=UPI00301919F3
MPDERNHSDNYTAADFERYYRGEMTAAERHRLEKAALEDPFLADALEGYALAATPARDAGFLKTGLEERLSSSRVVPLPAPARPHRLPLWKVAALVALVAGTAWMVYEFALTGTSSSVAKQEQWEPHPAADSETAPAARADTVSSVPPAPEAQSRPAPAPKKAKRAAAAARQQPPPEAQEAPLTATTAEAKASATDSDRIRSRVAAPLPARDKLLKAEGVRTLPSQDTTTLVMGYGTHKDQPVQLNETAVVRNYPPNRDMAAKRKAVATPMSAPIAANMQEQRIRYADVEPETGNPALNQYIVQNQAVPQNVPAKSPQGEVQLSFDLDAEGRPVNIKVTQPLCTPCDAEAVRLLTEGPKWISKDSSNKGKVWIRF